ncbi:Gfo/Idh/MocA family oxidoreductase [Sabulilitoribacter multivorans]|uniref:Gfo/Idh/MocA family oxidoreductase n=1 Tax=Flaviramulus multivorans TaxID=1304750 RepID=A0ABS9ILS0_9FLAO|nr:Gfo/Idh/MocA family oxidoreductase [Flaviramulus multivorans]MCF7561532.1 Gfo/Idh/MocA family oxidoreductase [Flaviramulus multivorans]
MSKSKKQKSDNSAVASRRSFIKNTTLVMGGISIIPRHVLGQGFTAPSDRINLGFIGLGKQGGILANYFISKTDVQIVAGAEVWQTKQKWFKNVVKDYYAQKRGISNYTGVKTYTEYQELISRNDIDAVVIATPDHWHAIQSIDAMNAGKDVFCEKPLTNTIKEGRAMVNATKKNRRVLQVGSMQRSWERFRKAKDIIDSGALGEIKQILVSVGDPAKPYDLLGEPIPKGLDWNLWCGPAPLLPYNNQIAPEIVKTYPKWRDYKETAGGLLSDWGAHMFDIVQWCIGTDRTGPIKYVPPQNPKALRGLKMYYENGIEMIHEDFGRGWGVRFIGALGSMDVSREYLETTPSDILSAMNVDFETLIKNNGNHYEDWLAAIKSRNQPICDVETGHRSATICNIANIAYELNETLIWNPVKEKFKGNAVANKMRKRQPRKYN